MREGKCRAWMHEDVLGWGRSWSDVSGGVKPPTFLALSILTRVKGSLHIVVTTNNEVLGLFSG